MIPSGVMGAELKSPGNQSNRTACFSAANLVWKEKNAAAASWMKIIHQASHPLATTIFHHHIKMG
jgi:hypothetical protein